MKNFNLNSLTICNQIFKSWLTNYELAAALQISYSTLYNYRKAGIIPFYRIQGRIYFRTEELFGLFARQN